MEITGSFHIMSQGAYAEHATGSGAFAAYGKRFNSTAWENTGNNGNWKWTGTDFYASRSWTGATSDNSTVSSVYGSYESGIRPTSLGLKVKTRYY